MTFNVQIFDANHKHVADFMNASIDDVLKFIHKGMTVVNQLTGEELKEEHLVAAIGVTECFMQIGA